MNNTTKQLFVFGVNMNMGMVKRAPATSSSKTLAPRVSGEKKEQIKKGGDGLTESYFSASHMPAVLLYIQMRIDIYIYIYTYMYM